MKKNIRMGVGTLRPIIIENLFTRRFKVELDQKDE